MQDKITLELFSPNEEAQAFIHTFTAKEHTRAFEIGVSVYNRVQASSDMDFIKGQVETLMATTENKIFQLEKTYLDIINRVTQEKFDPNVPTSFPKRFGDFLNTTAANFKDGLSKDGAQFKEVVQTYLTNVQSELKKIETNTSESETSILGRVRKLIVDSQLYLQSQFDESNTNSYAYKLQAEFTRALTALDQTVSATIQERMRAEISEALKPINEGITALRESVAREEGKAEIFEQTSAKGFVFEEVLFEQLQAIARPFGDGVEMTGLKKEASGSQKGDYIYTTADNNCIVIEAKDKPIGLKEAQDYMKLALEARGAKAGILVVKSPEQLQKQVGRWNVYDNFVMCCADDIEMSLKFIKFKLSLLNVKSDGINVGTLQAKLAAIEAEIKKFATIKTKLTNMQRGVSDGTEQIGIILDDVRKNVTALLTDAEQELNKKGKIE